MGLLDVFNKKDDDKIELLKREIINDYGKEEPYNKLINYIETKNYIYDYSLINEDDMIKIFRIMAKLLQDNSNIIENVKLFYDAVLLSSEQKDVDLFIKSLDKCKNKNFIVLFKNTVELFNDKSICINLIDSFIKKGYSDEFINSITSYMIMARPYYVDEVAFEVRTINLSLSLYEKSLDLEKLLEEIAKELQNDKMQAGIYSNIDEEKLFELNKKIDNTTKEINLLDAKVSKINIKMINLTVEIEKRIKELISDRTKTFEEKYDSITKIMEDAKNNSLQVTAEAKDKIESLGEHYLELLSEKAVKKGVKKASITGDKITNVSSNDTKPVKNYTTNLILDRNKYQEIKNNLKVSNMYFHNVFDKVLKYVLVKEPVMLVGPTGCGKTYIFKQISGILNLRLYDLGFVSDEYTIIRGYNDANGNFVKTPFYDALKNGGICLFDEIDNSESKALIELHKVIDGSGYRPYIFPNGEEVYPHPNFTVVATSNTWGDGQDRNYVAREKLDKASLGRFTRLKFDYDEKLNEKILSNYPDILDVVKYYNLALQKRGSDEILTTKDLGRIKYFMEGGLVSWTDIIDDKLIRNLPLDVLNAIINTMDQNIRNNIKYEEFKKKVKSM